MFEYLVLRFLHCILTFGVFIKQCTNYFIHFGLAYKQKSSINLIKSDARHLKKMPVHLGIVVLEDNHSYSDIANIIIWSLALGISCISVYDIDGEFKRNQVFLKEEVIKRQKEVLCDESSKYHICIHSSKQHSNVENGYSSSNRIDIQLLSQEDGRQGLVKMAQKLSKEVNTKNFKLEDITPQNVDSLLQETNKFPDPDLVIKFGAVDALLGFLPWQIRLTEILSYKTHCGLTYKSFISLFYSYGKTQQRFGR